MRLFSLVRIVVISFVTLGLLGAAVLTWSSGELSAGTVIMLTIVVALLAWEIRSFIRKGAGATAAQMSDVTFDRARQAGRVGTDSRMATEKRNALIVGAVVLAYPLLRVIRAVAANSGDGQGASAGLFMGVIVAIAVGAWWLLNRSGLMVSWLVRRMHAAPASKHPAGVRLLSLLEDVKLAAGLEHGPELFVVESPAVNVFAVGISPKRGAVVITSRLVEMLSLPQTRALIAIAVLHLVSGRAMTTTVSHNAGQVSRTEFEFAADIEAMHLLKDPESLLLSFKSVDGQSPVEAKWLKVNSAFAQPSVWPVLAPYGGAGLPGRLARLNETLGAMGGYAPEAL